MRTTLDLPDDVFRQVKAKAALEGATLKDMLTRYIESGLRHPGRPAGAPARRSRLPVVPKRGQGVIPSLTPELQARLEEEEDLAKLDRSFGGQPLDGRVPGCVCQVRRAAVGHF